MYLKFSKLKQNKEILGPILICKFQKFNIILLIYYIIIIIRKYFYQYH